MSRTIDVYSVDACPLNESQLNIYLDIVANNKIDSYLIPLYINIIFKALCTSSNA